ncbi:cation:proton antiporter [Streptomyces sp. NPDC055966]|uniref:cation:proton antiporter domain-containing protein n=1 Tax=Streptomyces sp. NPDC055966 TaxID=3345669 RepID=UPI0035DAADCD
MAVAVAVAVGECECDGSTRRRRRFRSGVVLGSTRHKLGDASVRLQVRAVYDTVTFLLESVVFALIGLELPSAVRHLARDEHGWPLWVPVIAFTLLAIRLLWIFPLSALIHHRHGQGDNRLSWRVPAVLSWAGTRGVMPLAAALSIPLATHTGAPLPHRALILTLTTGTVAVTLVFQGFTLAPVVRRSGIALEPEHTAREEARTRRHIARAALDELKLLGDPEHLADLGTNRSSRDAAPPRQVPGEYASASFFVFFEQKPEPGPLIRGVHPRHTSGRRLQPPPHSVVGVALRI